MAQALSEIAVLPTTPTITAAEFEAIRALARRQFGLDLKPGKEALVAARLSRRLQALGLISFEAYLDYLAADRSGRELADLIDALTTNFTSFLREPAHFEFLRRSMLPRLSQRRSISIWSAGCATGEEPYTIAMVTLDAANTRWSNLRILASDISNRALETARRGIYPSARVDSLPENWKSRFLQIGCGQWQDHFRFKADVRDLVAFRRINLMESLQALPRFPVIFCRNVMIYFDRAIQQRVITRLEEHLEPGGILFIGHSEGLTGIRHSMDYVMPAVYRKPGALSKG
jgi:chemotaxis protein methyltransferase CheR